MKWLKDLFNMNNECRVDGGYGKCRLPKGHEHNHMTVDKIRWGPDFEGGIDKQIVKEVLIGGDLIYQPIEVQNYIRECLRKLKL